MHNPAFCRSGCNFVIAEKSLIQEYAATEERPELVEEQIAAIRGVLQRLTRIRILNPTDAEDLVQETLLTLVAKCPSSELQKGLLVWSLGVLRKKVGNYYRRVQRYTCLTGQEQYAQSVRDISSPEARVLHDELQKLIRQALSRFPAPQREAIELLIAGLDAGEIAERFGSENYQNVINHIYRGRRKLAKELAKFGYGPEAKVPMRRMKRCGSKK